MERKIQQVYNSDHTSWSEIRPARPPVAQAMRWWLTRRPSLIPRFTAWSRRGWGWTTRPPRRNLAPMESRCGQARPSSSCSASSKPQKILLRRMLLRSRMDSHQERILLSQPLLPHLKTSFLTTLICDIIKHPPLRSVSKAVDIFIINSKFRTDSVIQKKFQVFFSCLGNPD